MNSGRKKSFGLSRFFLTGRGERSPDDMSEDNSKSEGFEMQENIEVENIRNESEANEPPTIESVKQAVYAGPVTFYHSVLQ